MQLFSSVTTSRVVSVVMSYALAALLLHAGSLQAAPGVNEESAPQPIVIPFTPQGEGGPPKIPEVPRDQVIGFALYTVENQTLKLSAQLYPLQKDEPRRVELQVQEAGKWQTLAKADVDEQGWLAVFRLENWDSSRDVAYRVTHPGGAVFQGTIRKDPVDKDEIVVAAFTGNSNRDRGDRADIVRNVLSQDPDLLFFSGDQSYDHKHHTAAWLLFGRQFKELMRDRPTITIPDDHDVGQNNLWGAGGKVSSSQAGPDGGYFMPADYVKMVERAQTSHLPDPYDPTPIEQGIGVYYTSLNVGGIDFAIVEDRKWKTGPAGLVPQQGPRPDHINDPNYDRSTVDLPEAQLLGKRQLAFLDTWSQDWRGTEMKAVLSQTIFAGGAHIHGKHDERVLADLDSNGWPQAGRQRALHAMRRCFAFHIAGDQHLATVIHHGTQTWEDACYSFCVPSIVNFYGRWWWPLEDSQQALPGNRLRFAGRFYDGLGNKVTMHAYANPTSKNHNAAGYGIVRFNKPKRTITMECWPRHGDVTTSPGKQYPGWPITIRQEDNYARQPLAFLPTILIRGRQDPVVQVVDETLDEVVYTLRIQGDTWRPKVFRDGRYTIRVGEGDTAQSVHGIRSTSAPEETQLEFAF